MIKEHEFILHNDEYDFNVTCIFSAKEKMFKVDAAQYAIGMGFYTGKSRNGSPYPSFTNFNRFLRMNYIQDRFCSGDWIKLDTLYKILNKCSVNSRRFRVTKWLIDELTKPPVETPSCFCPFAAQNNTHDEINEIVGEINTLVAKLQKMLA